MKKFELDIVMKVVYPLLIVLLSYFADNWKRPSSVIVNGTPMTAGQNWLVQSQIRRKL